MRTPLPRPSVPVRALRVAAAAAVGVAVAVPVALVTPAGDDEIPQGTVVAASTDVIRPFDPTRTGAEQAVARAQRRLAAAELAPLPFPSPTPEPEPEPEPEHEEDHVHEHPTTTSGRWDALAQCESGGDWSSTVGTYEGGLQFHPGTWDAYRDPGMPDAAYRASREVQIRVAERVLASQGWGAWPACSRKLGYR